MVYEVRKEILILVIFCLLISFYSYNAVYNTKNNQSNIRSKIENFINKGLENKKNKVSIDIIESVVIDNKKIIVFNYNNILGFSELTKGINNKYKINYVNSTNDVFSLFLSKTNKSELMVKLNLSFMIQLYYLTTKV